MGIIVLFPFFGLHVPGFYRLHRCTALFAGAHMPLRGGLPYQYITSCTTHMHTIHCVSSGVEGAAHRAFRVEIYVETEPVLGSNEACPHSALVPLYPGALPGRGQAGFDVVSLLVCGNDLRQNA